MLTGLLSVTSEKEKSSHQRKSTFSKMSMLTSFKTFQSKRTSFSKLKKSKNISQTNLKTFVTKTNTKKSYANKNRQSSILFLPVPYQNQSQSERNLSLLLKSNRQSPFKKKATKMRKMKKYKTLDTKDWRKNLSTQLNCKSWKLKNPWNGKRLQDWNLRKNLLTKWLFGQCYDRIFLLACELLHEEFCCSVRLGQERQWSEERLPAQQMRRFLTSVPAHWQANGWEKAKNWSEHCFRLQE